MCSVLELQGPGERRLGEADDRWMGFGGELPVAIEAGKYHVLRSRLGEGVNFDAMCRELLFLHVPPKISKT